MAKISLAGFKDPVRRPRYIIWALVAVLVIAGVMVPVLGVTSTRWFCAEACHKVQDDTIIAYEHSSHAKVSCMACHMPVNANPVIFILHKAEALGELYLTVRDDYDLPLNGESEVALTMTGDKCTQCHSMETRKVTPSEGVKIDHAVHAEVNAACPVCHNRVAHNEDFKLTLTNPKTGQPNTKHLVFTSMTSCFRCHGLEDGAAAPGRCSACHPSDFELKPENHREKDFYPKGHAEMAKEAKEEAAKALEASAEGEGAEGEKEQSLLGTEKAYASGGGEEKPVSKEEVKALLEEQKKNPGDEMHSIGGELPKVESIYYCGTCHVEKQFCDGCHGMEMPHPAAFKEPTATADPAQGHPAMSKKFPKKCVMCHGKNEESHFCDNCHHGVKAGGYKFVANEPWTAKQHPKAVAEKGIKTCTAECHEAKFCSDCHTSKKVFPASHKQAGWIKPGAPGALTVYGKTPAKVSGKHAVEAQKSIEACDVCHAGGVNGAFCKSCHKLEMPHPADFKTNHVSSKKNSSQCKKCHQFKEVCSNCHHIGSSTSKSWISIHGGSVNKNGAAGCVEKCHTKNDCVKCHTKRNVVPASHKQSKFIRDFSNKDAKHVQLYKDNGEICTYCHKGEVAALPNAKFCSSCHKLEMPHPDGFGAKGAGNGGAHAKSFADKKLSKATCSNCHKTSFCNSCHHEGAPANKPWVRYHPNVVKKNGTDGCFGCHKPTFCANCHVNLAKKGLLN